MSKEGILKKKLYFSFEVRIIIMVIIMLFSFFIGCFFIFKVISFTKMEAITYDESSDVHYEVCLLQNEHYEDTCLKEDMEYISDLTHNIYVNFLYNVKMSSNISYNLGYHISGITKIYDANNSNKVFYQNEDKLLNSVDISDNSNVISINEHFVFDYEKYNKLVKNYKSNYALNSVADFELILYLEEGEEVRKVAAITIPLGVQTYGVNKNVLSNTNKKVPLESNSWNSSITFYIVIASSFVMLALFLLYRISKLILKVTINRNKYQKYLTKILKEYDDCIVNTRDSYEYPKYKQVIKVSSFEELVDAKNILKKPIIYSKINDVKSEFVVEDDDKLFIYILKESDL